MEDIKLMKGNEVLAYAAIRCGADGYFGYPITPQSEVLETLTELRPWETTGMVVLQAESEVASINMVYGGASAGKRVMTSTSSPGLSLMCEGLSYLAGAELPCVVIDVSRGGPGLGTIQASQADYFQVVKGGGHGDYRTPVLAPNSVQEMNDFVELAFDLAFKYLNPVVILADGVIGQMMEKVKLSPQKPRRTEAQIRKECPWAALGKGSERKARNIVTSCYIDPETMERHNRKLQEKYDRMERDEVRCEEIETADAEYILVAYGVSSRICAKVVEDARSEGLRVGLIRPITLFPFPAGAIRRAVERGVRGFLSVELSMGQMIEDVRSAAGDARLPVRHFGRTGGIIHSPREVYDALKRLMTETGGLQ
ncbi:MAG: 3-methyl-2-oxobutanoate dehydrogenase subunit VorB [Rikenella sp.]|nr:3-methyl-2-oxobutanoate dehydrogenase subunit VorB [Rikenella sp.]